MRELLKKDLFSLIIRRTESLFSGSASNERKYWGFVVFQRVLPRVKATDLPMLFTKNFMRTWINHLSHFDRYLHSFAKQIASPGASYFSLFMLIIKLRRRKRSSLLYKKTRRLDSVLFYN